jgi:DNA-repair protein complementing XP-A cells
MTLFSGFFLQEKETKLVDTNAGFFIEETEGGESSSQMAEPLPAPVLEPDRPECEECGEELADSHLFRNFNLEVCDKCKETEKDGKHELITKTDAKNEFLLKDTDFVRPEPALKFIARKNPHKESWGEMKLYLRVQVEKRALEVWGSEEALEAEHEKREDRRDQLKVKKFNKKLKALKMQVRGSLYKKVDISVHEHEYGEEVYNEDEDQYSRTCKTCDHVHSYEKM